MLDGECVGFGGVICCNEYNPLEIGVYRSAAGYYMGYWCPECGPYSRETGYYPTKEACLNDNINGKRS